MAGRSTHFAAPLLLAVVTGLIVYVSLYPFRFIADGPALVEALRSLGWARAGRGDMFNNVLLYVPFGFCVALLIEPRWGRASGVVVGTLLGAMLSLTRQTVSEVLRDFEAHGWLKRRYGAIELLDLDALGRIGETL